MITLYIVLMTLIILMAFTGGFILLWMKLKPLRRRNTKRRLEQVRERLKAVYIRIPHQRNIAYSEYPVIEASASIEAWLLQNRPKNALIAAMHAVKSEPESGDAYLHLARTLLFCDEIEGARRALQRAQSLGQSGVAVDYLETRIQLQINGILEESFEVQHSDKMLGILERLLDTVEKDPNFGDAAYHLGRLALAIGLREEGKRLLEKVEPLMDASPERPGYQIDLNRLN